MNNKDLIKININTEDPLNQKKRVSKKVDINILKSKIQKAESMELKKNILIVSFLIIGLFCLGLYLSL
tara:strand:- start:420 stop:623 length:204 start_codon:yes stop_codon:yes gene_type:complete